MRTLLFVLLSLIGTAGCRSLDPDRTSDQASGPVWVAQTFSGGVQCDPSVEYDPPDTRSLLEEAGVQVLDTAVEHLGVIAVCGASSYAAVHYALVSAETEEGALALGFERSEAPPGEAQR